MGEPVELNEYTIAIDAQGAPSKWSDTLLAISSWLCTAAQGESEEEQEVVEDGEPLLHPVQLPRGLTNAELNDCPPLTSYFKINLKNISPWKEIAADITKTSAPGTYIFCNCFKADIHLMANFQIDTLKKKLKKHPVELVLKFYQATRNMTEEDLSELLDLIHEKEFDPQAIPRNLYEYKRLREHLLPMQRLHTYEYSTEVDGQVRATTYLYIQLSIFEEKTRRGFITYMNMSFIIFEVISLQSGVDGDNSFLGVQPPVNPCRRASESPAPHGVPSWYL